jgi:hypothetical protein
MKEYTKVDGKYYLSMEQESGVLIKDLLENEKFTVEEYYDEFRDPNYTAEPIGIDIYRIGDKKCRVWCECGFVRGHWNLGIDINLFLMLKQELILIQMEMKPKIKEFDKHDNVLIYTIEVEGETLGDVVEAANKFDKDISKKIIGAVHCLPNIPELLKLFLGIKNPQLMPYPWLKSSD